MSIVWSTTSEHRPSRQDRREPPEACLCLCPTDPPMELEEMERRLEMQSFEGGSIDAGPCVWFVCTDVCPPGG